MDHELEKFLAVAEMRSFTKAAKELRISQPALSVSIKNLERSLGVKLIVRGLNRFALTSEGAIVYESARRMRSELSAMQRLLEQKAGHERPLKIGMIDSIGELFFGSDTPNDIRLEIAVDASKRLIEDVKLDRLDMAVVVAQTQPLDKSLMHQVLPSEPFRLVTHTRIAPKIRRELQQKKLTSWLAYNPGSTTQQHFLRQWRELGVQAEPIFASTSPYLIKQMAVSGRGAALLPLHMVSRDLKKGSLVLVSHKRFNRPIWCIQQRDVETKEELELLVQAISNKLEEL